jgi:hypothetical protein
MIFVYRDRSFLPKVAQQARNGINISSFLVEGTGRIAGIDTITSTQILNLPINAVLGDGTPELDRKLPDNILRKIFRE